MVSYLQYEPLLGKRNEKISRFAGIMESFMSFHGSGFLSDKPVKWLLCSREQTFDGQRTVSDKCRELRDKPVK